jgi:tetratricopeptide (TPR) repeat protein
MNNHSTPSPIWGRLLILATLVLRLYRPAAEATQRMSIAFLRPQNLSSNEAWAHWHFSLPTFFECETEGRSNFRFLPQISVESAFHQLGLDDKRQLAEAEVLQVGRLLEARRVIWSSYSREGGTWNLKFQIMNVASGEGTTPRTVTAPEWKDVIERALFAICESIGCTNCDQGNSQTPVRLSRSSQALELMSQACAETIERNGLSNEIQKVREALNHDPHFPLALCALVNRLRLQGSEDEALRVAQSAVKEFPNDAGCHAALGRAYVAKKRLAFGREEFQEAIRLDPDTPEYLLDLADINFERGELDRCSSALEEAGKLMPLVSYIHAFLGQVRASQRRRQDALAELRLAERYDTGDDLGTVQQLAMGFERANEPSKAVLYYENYLGAAKKLGVGPQFTERATIALAAQKSRLIAQRIATKEPHSYNEAEFDAAVKNRLSSDEAEWVRDPFATTAEMKHFAKQTVSGLGSDEDKAKELFRVLVRSTDSIEGGTCRTAEEAFKHWQDLQISMNCQDFTLLYIALARSLGLKVYFTDVGRDYTGSYVSHACAADFTGTNAVLVDPMYRWFGVPHQKYELHDDLEVAGLLLAESGDSRKEDAGLKLLHGWPGARFMVALARIRRGGFADGRETLEEAIKLDPDSYLADYGRAVIETYDKHWNQAEIYLRKCLGITPGWNQARFLLGEVLSKQNKLPQAREQWRLYLTGTTDPNLAATARSAIALINESYPD